MKRSWIITICLCLLLLVGGGIAIFMPRTVPFSQCSEIYKKYADHPDIDASFIKEFKINDSISVDVTLLKAIDTSGWKTLSEDLCITVPDTASQRQIDNGTNLIFTKKVKSNDCSQTDTTNSDDAHIMAVSYLNKTVCIFHTMNRRERHAVWFYNFDKSTGNKTNK